MHPSSPIRKSFASAPSNSPVSAQPTTKKLGDAAEKMALHHLERAGLRLIVRNFSTPGRGGGEIDLIMRDTDGTLVFIEVRARRSSGHGGAAASVGFAKQRRIVLAARHYLMRLPKLPPCRFDVFCIDGIAPDVQVHWIKAAFDAA